MFYGFFHNRTLAAQAETKRFNDEYARKEKLIAEAKAKYAELNKPKKTEGGAVFDLEDPNFDASKAISAAVEQLE